MVQEQPRSSHPDLISLPPSVRVEGYAIVSDDGMLADANGAMPPSLKLEADQRFFEHGLDGVDVVIHGRFSQEAHPNSPRRHRIVVTRRIETIARDPSNGNAVLWNPGGAALEDALELLGTAHRSLGIVGGTEVFALFLKRYDVFYLSRAHSVRLPGGRPVFPQVPEQSPSAVLQAHGYACSAVERPMENLTIETWLRNRNRA